MKNILSKINLWHILGWVVYILFAWYDMLFKEGIDWEYFPLDVTNELVIFIVFYLFYFFIWQHVLASNKRWLMALWIPLGIGIFIIIRYIIQEQLFLLIFGYDNYNDALGHWFYIRDNIPRGIVPVIASLVVFLIENKWIPERDKFSLEKELKESELSFLRSQINPHFLFNTLSFLHTRAYAKDEELAEGIRKLSDILRYAVDNSTSEKRLVNDEIELLRNFISIHQFRFDKNCFVEFEVINDFGNLTIEPLLLLPFVENAFKHGIYDVASSPVIITLQKSDDQLIFTCTNKINHAQKDQSSGIGLENIKRRLDIQYPNNHTLQLSEKEDIYSATLTLTL